MLDFVKRAFRGGITALLWINLILWTVGGGIAGYYLGKLISYRDASGYAFGGVLIGIICGLLSNIIGGGFIVTILSIEKNTEETRNLLMNKPGVNTAAGTANSKKESGVSKVLNNNLYTVKQKMKLFKEKNKFDAFLEILNIGDQVEFLETGSIVTAGEKRAPMFSVKTGNGNVGWCFSGNLEKM